MCQSEKKMTSVSVGNLRRVMTKHVRVEDVPRMLPQHVSVKDVPRMISKAPLLRPNANNAATRAENVRKSTRETKRPKWHDAFNTSTQTGAVNNVRVSPELTLKIERFKRNATA